VPARPGHAIRPLSTWLLIDGRGTWWTVHRILVATAVRVQGQAAPTTMIGIDETRARSVRRFRKETGWVRMSTGPAGSRLGRPRTVRVEHRGDGERVTQIVIEPTSAQSRPAPLLASLLIDSGLDVKVVQTRLRHASAMTTLNTYGHMWSDVDESSRGAVSVVLAARKNSSRTARVPTDVCAGQRLVRLRGRSTSRTTLAWMTAVENQWHRTLTCTDTRSDHWVAVSVCGCAEYILSTF
jgi:hypothetical protein